MTPSSGLPLVSSSPHVTVTHEMPTAPIPTASRVIERCVYAAPLRRRVMSSAPAAVESSAPLGSVVA